VVVAVILLGALRIPESVTSIVNTVVWGLTGLLFVGEAVAAGIGIYFSQHET
jgi:ABC-type branched-subunit amino acid transport system permease subunit